jgi:hypothetical protein
MEESTGLTLEQIYKAFPEGNTSYIEGLVEKYGVEKAGELWLDKVVEEKIDQNFRKILQDAGIYECRSTLEIDEENRNQNLKGLSFMKVNHSRDVQPIKQKNSYGKRCKKELDKLICGHPDYNKEHQGFCFNAKMINMGLATEFATKISPIIGLPSAIIVPTVALFLYSLGKIGISAYCQFYTPDNE